MPKIRWQLARCKNPSRPQHAGLRCPNPVQYLCHSCGHAVGFPIRPRQFDAVVVTNYLWRALFPVMLTSLAPGGVLIYETFAAGNETVGKPSRPDFLLQPGELLRAFAELHVVAFEEGYLAQSPRFVQRLVAVKPDLSLGADQPPTRYPL